METAEVGVEALEGVVVLVIVDGVVQEVLVVGEDVGVVEVHAVAAKPLSLSPIVTWEFSSQEERKTLW